MPNRLSRFHVYGLLTSARHFGGIFLLTFYFKKRMYEMRYCIFGILSLFFTIGQANAEVISCNNGKYADGTDCVSCGADCNWSIDLTSGKLTVSGSGNMKNYSFYKEDDINYSSAPWGGYKNRITAVEVSGMSSIGRCAFCHLAVNSIQMDDSVKKINESAFAWNGSGASSVLCPTH